MLILGHWTNNSVELCGLVLWRRTYDPLELTWLICHLWADCQFGHKVVDQALATVQVGSKIITNLDETIPFSLKPHKLIF